MLRQFILDRKGFEAISANPLVNQRDPQGLTPLQLAAREGIENVVLLLIYAGAEIDGTTEKQSDNPQIVEDAAKTPLYIAMERGHHYIAQILYACGASVFDAAHTAHKLKRPDLVKQLIQLTVDPNVMVGMLCWQAINYDARFKIRLFDKLQPQLKSFLENKRTQIKIILEEEGQDLRFDITLEVIEESLPDGKMDGIASSEAGVPEVKLDIQTVSPSCIHRIQENIGAVIELAVKMKCIELAEALIQMDKIKLRRDRECPTAGYWAMIHDDPKIYPFVFPEVEDRIMALVHIHSKSRREFADRMQQFEKDFKEPKEFKNFRKTVLRRTSESWLSPLKFKTDESRELYQAASENRTLQVKNLSDNNEDYFDAVLQAFSQKNFVALQILASACQDHNSLINFLMQNNQHEYVRFWLMMTNLDRYNVVLTLNQAVACDFADRYWSRSGVMHAIFGQSIGENPPTEAMTTVVKNLSSPQTESPQIEPSTALLRCVADRLFVNCKMDSEYLVTVGNSSLSPAIRAKIFAFFDRFHLPIKMNDEIFNLLPRGIWREIFEYTSSDGHRELQKWLDLIFNDLMIPLKKDDRWIKADELQGLLAQDKLLNEFIQAFDQENSARGCCKVQGLCIDPCCLHQSYRLEAKYCGREFQIDRGYFLENQGLRFLALCVVVTLALAAVSKDSLFQFLGCLFGIIGGLVSLGWGCMNYCTYPAHVTEGPAEFQAFELGDFSRPTVNAALAIINDFKKEAKNNPFDFACAVQDARRQVKMGRFLGAARSTHAQFLTRIKVLQDEITEIDQKAKGSEDVDKKDQEANESKKPTKVSLESVLSQSTVSPAKPTAELRLDVLPESKHAPSQAKAGSPRMFNQASAGDTTTDADQGYQPLLEQPATKPAASEDNDQDYAYHRLA